MTVCHEGYVMQKFNLKESLVQAMEALYNSTKITVLLDNQTRSFPPHKSRLPSRVPSFA